MEFTLAEPTETTQLASDLPIWRLSMDGAANAHGSGAGLILTSPDGIDVEYALIFGFQVSNNEVEYEAIIVGLNLAYYMEDDQLEVCNDSQLVVKQIEDDYEVKGEKMTHYLKKVRELLKSSYGFRSDTSQEQIIHGQTPWLSSQRSREKIWIDRYQSTTSWNLQ